MDDSDRPAASFEHPVPDFPEEHYLAVRELAQTAEEEHPPCQAYPDLWWTKGTGAQDRAVKICKTRCTMREQCLQFALTTGEKDGVWGGCTPAERKSMTPLQADTEQENHDDPPSGPPAREPSAAPAPAGPGEHRIQERTAGHHRAPRSQQAAQPPAEHRPQRSRQPV